MGRQCAGSDGTGLAACAGIRSCLWSAKCTLRPWTGKRSFKVLLLGAPCLMYCLQLSSFAAPSCSIKLMEKLPVKIQSLQTAALGLAAV